MFLCVYLRVLRVGRGDSRVFGSLRSGRGVLPHADKVRVIWAHARGPLDHEERAAVGGVAGSFVEGRAEVVRVPMLALTQLSNYLTI